MLEDGWMALMVNMDSGLLCFLAVSTLSCLFVVVFLNYRVKTPLLVESAVYF